MLHLTIQLIYCIVNVLLRTRVYVLLALVKRSLTLTDWQSYSRVCVIARIIYFMLFCLKNTTSLFILFSDSTQCNVTIGSTTQLNVISLDIILSDLTIVSSYRTFNWKTLWMFIYVPCFFFSGSLFRSFSSCVSLNIYFNLCTLAIFFLFPVLPCTQKPSGAAWVIVSRVWSHDKDTELLKFSIIICSIVLQLI